MKPKDFDEILDNVGSYGKYQVMVNWLIISSTSFIIAITINVNIFIFLSPDDYWCHVDGREATNFSSAQWRALTIPKDENGNFEKCRQYNTSDIKISHINSNKVIEDCSSWDHNKLQIEQSVITQNGWFCDKQHYSAQVLSVALAGNAVGTFIFPILADKYTGRRLMFFILMILFNVVSLLTLFVTDVTLMSILYFARGSVFQANYQMPYVIGLELMTPDKRGVASLYSFAAWTFGMCSTALIAWAVQNWIQLTLLACAITVPQLFLWWIIPESPRWLLSKGRTSHCTDILLKVAKTNGRTDIKRATLQSQLDSLYTQVEDGQLYQKFLKHKKVVLNCIFLMIQAVAVFMAYLTLVLNVKILPNNYYLSFFILSLSELPSNVIGWLCVEYLGRKMTAVLTYSLSIILCICAVFVIEDKITLIIFVALLKLTVTSGILVLYIMTSEIFPTPIRSTGMGLVVVCGMTGGAFAPHIVTYDSNGLFQYWCIMGLCAVSILMSLFLPETLGLPLPQTFPEANNLNSNRPWWKWINHWNKKDYLPVRTSERVDEAAF